MINMRTLVIGDIHGQYKSMLDVLAAAEYNSDVDRLIVLGDEVDGGRDSYKVVEYLASQPNVIKILGNHDAWFINYIKTGFELPAWIHQGGSATLASYSKENRGKIPIKHAEYLHAAYPYFIDSNKNIYVHGGFNPLISIKEQDVDDLTWDRSLIKYAKNNVIPSYRHVFVGHTTTTYYNSFKPLTFNNLTMMDTGAGWHGHVTVMDVDTFDYWQSKLIIRWEQ